LLVSLTLSLTGSVPRRLSIRRPVALRESTILLVAPAAIVRRTLATSTDRALLAGARAVSVLVVRHGRTVHFSLNATPAPVDLGVPMSRTCAAAGPETAVAGIVAPHAEPAALLLASPP